MYRFLRSGAKAPGTAIYANDSSQPDSSLLIISGVTHPALSLHEENIRVHENLDTQKLIGHMMTVNRAGRPEEQEWTARENLAKAELEHSSSCEILRSSADSRILCVDQSHGLRAILAQTFLEIKGAQIVNETGRCPFGNVDSAGLNIKTPFQNAVGPLTSKALRDFIAPFPDADLANERSRIVDRRLDTRNQTFDSLHLKDYDFIICFDRSSVDRVNKQLREDASTAKVVLLPGCSRPSFGSFDLRKLVITIKSAVEDFASEELRN